MDSKTFCSFHGNRVCIYLSALYLFIFTVKVFMHFNYIMSSWKNNLFNYAFNFIFNAFNFIFFAKNKGLYVYRACYKKNFCTHDCSFFTQFSNAVAKQFFIFTCQSDKHNAY